MFNLALSLDKHDCGIEVSFYGLRRRNDYHKGTGRVRSLKAAILLCRIHKKWATNSWIAQFEFVGRSIDFPFSSKRMFLQELKNNIGPPLPMSYREEAALEWNESLRLAPLLFLFLSLPTLFSLSLSLATFPSSKSLRMALRNERIKTRGDCGYFPPFLFWPLRIPTH